ncbi:carboxymuconolactone decarboxylase family protein [Microvirga sp. 0TCS3.31]
MTQRMNYAAAAPGGMKALGSVYSYVAQSGLPATLIELVYLRVSQINGCAYCIDMHSRDLLKAEVPVEKLVLVPASDEAGTLFSDQEKAALKWAEVVTRVSDTHVPEAAYAEARAAFSEKELADLTIAIGLMNAFNRLAISFRVPPLATASAA